MGWNWAHPCETVEVSLPLDIAIDASKEELRMEPRDDKRLLDQIILRDEDILFCALLLNRAGFPPSLWQVNIRISCQKLHEHAVGDNDNVFPFLILEAFYYLEELLSHSFCAFLHSVIVGGVAIGFLQLFLAHVIKR